MIKKHEQEKMAAMKEDELQIEDEMEAVWVLPYLLCRFVYIDSFLLICTSFPRRARKILCVVYLSLRLAL